MNNIQHWQLDFLERVKGSKPGEMTVMMAVQRTGKSTLNSLMYQAMQEYFNPPLEGFDLTEKEMSGNNYYCVEPIGGNWAEMFDWAKETFGEPGDLWEAHQFVWPDTDGWYANNRKFWFRNEKDRTLFLMKWS